MEAQAGQERAVEELKRFNGRLVEELQQFGYQQSDTNQRLLGELTEFGRRQLETTDRLHDLLMLNLEKYRIHTHPTLEIARPRSDSDLALAGVQVYLDYRRLGPSQLADILRSIEELFRAIYGLLIIPEEDVHLLTRRKFETSVSRHLKGHPEDQLNLSWIQTGDSIKFKVVAGWRTGIASTAEGDLVLKLPKGVAAVVVVGGILSAATAGITTTTKEALESWKTYGEIQLHEKQKEKLDLEIQELKKKLTAAPSINDSCDASLHEFISKTVGDHNMKRVEIDVSNELRGD